MSTTIDERVVEMRFDNQHFERNVQTSLGTIDKLKNSLNMTGASRGLESVSAAASRTQSSFGELEGVAYKAGWNIRDAWYKIGDVLEYQVARRIIEIGKQTANALLGVEAAQKGFSEYELKMGSIQTIMAGTGESLETVNKYLNELNEYSDKTIYSFSDMTSNIGKFTNAGVKLDDAVSAIKGISNVAAVSGANTNEASRAMYNFSQALSAGYVKLIDWKSIENANMATVEFKQQLIDTALSMGTITKASDGMYKTLDGNTFNATKNFNEVFQDQWLTSDVLIKTLGNYADETTEIGKKASAAATEVKTFTQMMDTLKESAQSGWAQTWEIIFGDFEEGKTLWTNISEVIGGFIDKSSEARNELLENWEVLGGKADLFDAVKYTFEGIVNILGTVKDAFSEIFPPLTAENLANFAARLKELAEKFKMATEDSSNLKRTFKGLFAVLNIAKKIFSGLMKIVGTVLGYADDLIGGILGVTATVGDWLVSLDEAIEHTNIFEGVLDGIIGIIKGVIGVVGKLYDSFKNSFVFTVISGAVESFITVLSNAENKMDRLAEIGGEIKNAWLNSGLFKTLNTIWTTVKKVVSGIINLFSGFAKGIGDAFGKGDFAAGFEIINGLLSGGLLIGLTAFVKKLGDLVLSPKQFLDSVAETFDGITEAVKDFLGQTTSFSAQLRSIATSILMLAAALILLSFVDPDKLADGLAAMALALAAVVGAQIALTKNAKVLGKGEKLAGTGIVTLAASLMLIALALKQFSKIDAESMERGVTGMVICLGALVGAQVLVSRFAAEESKIKQSAKSMITMGIALLLVSIVVKQLGSMDWASWGRGMMGITIVLAAMAGAMIMFTKLAVYKKGSSQKMIDAAKSMVIMSIALIAVGHAVKQLGSMDWATWGRGLIGMVVALGAFGGVQVLLKKFAGDGKTMILGTTSIAIMAAAISLIVPAIAILGVLPTKMLIQGALGLTGVLAALVGAQIMMTKLAGTDTKQMLLGATSIAIMSASIGLITPALLTLGLMPTKVLIQGALGLVGVLASLAGAQIMMTKLAGSGKEMISAAGAIAIMAASIGLIIPALTLLGLLPTRVLIQGALGLVGILAALAGAQVMMTKLAGSGKEMILAATSLVIMAAAINILVPALLMLSMMDGAGLAVSLGAIAGALLILGVAAKVLSPLAPVIITLAGGLALMGAAVMAFGAGLILLGAGLVAMGKGLIVLVGGLTVVAGAIGTVAVGLTTLVSSVIKGIIVGLGEGFVALCQVLIDSIDILVELGITLIQALCKAIIECVPTIVDTLLTLITKALESLAKFTPLIVGSILDLIMGVIKAIAERIPDLVGAVVDVLFALVKGVIQALSANLNTDELLQMLTNVGILAAIMAALAAMSLLAPAAMIGVVGMTAVLGELTFALAALGKLYQIDGLKELVEDGGALMQAVGTAIGSFVGGIVGGIAKGITSVLPQIGQDLSDFMTNAQPFFDGVGSVTSESLSGIKTLVGIITQLTAVNIIDGLTRWFTGGSSLTKFGEELAAFAPNIKQYADTVSGIDASAVEASANAAKMLSEVATNLPNSGGLAAIFAGDNNIGDFGEQLVPFGEGMKKYSEAVTGVDAEAITSSAQAAKALTEVANAVPNSGGLAAIFAGDNNIGTFGDDLEAFGAGIKAFSEQVAGIDAESSKGAIETAKSLVELTNNIPNEGGVAAWFAGENSISKFANDLITLGQGLAGFSLVTTNVNGETMMAAANAGKVLAEMTNTIPNEGGIASWFAGENSISKFSADLIALGQGLAGFSEATISVNPETMTAAANAAKTLGEMTNTIPNEGGIAAWFTNENSISKFGSDLVALGKGLAGFSESTAGVNPETMAAASEAGKKLAEMTNTIPNEGGIKSWFSGESGMAKFTTELVSLGKGLAGFSEATVNVNPETMSAAAEAGKNLAEMTKTIPNEGGIKAWFSGESGLAKFSSNLPTLGKALTSFSESVADINPENVTAAAKAGKNLAEMTKTVPGDSKKIVSFGDNLSKFSEKVKSYFAAMSEVSTDTISASGKAIDAIKKLADINAGNIKSVASAIKEFTNAVKKMASEIKTDLSKAGKEAIEAFIKGINDKLSAAEKAAKSILTGCVDALEGKKADFESAGANLVAGFANGISANTYKAEAKARAMAKAAADAAKKELDEHSPSKVGYGIGDYFGIAFVNGISDNIDKAYDASSEAATAAKKGLSAAIAKVQDVINGDLDTQPTIRPVLDLSDVESGASAIGNLFGSKSSFGLNIGAISSAMRNRSQNGEMMQIASEIDKLNKNLTNMEHATYNINGLSFTEGDDLAEAMKVIMRYAQIVRRT